jgi:hypothetical protein
VPFQFSFSDELSTIVRTAHPHLAGQPDAGVNMVSNFPG